METCLVNDKSQMDSHLLTDSIVIVVHFRYFCVILHFRMIHKQLYYSSYNNVLIIFFVPLTFSIFSSSIRKNSCWLSEMCMLKTERIISKGFSSDVVQRKVGLLMAISNLPFSEEEKSSTLIEHYFCIKASKRLRRRKFILVGMPLHISAHATRSNLQI